MDKYGRVDVWKCMKCNIFWRCPCVPHNSKCPKCGEGGWWQRFATPEELKTAIS